MITLASVPPKIDLTMESFISSCQLKISALINLLIHTELGVHYEINKYMNSVQ